MCPLAYGTRRSLTITKSVAYDLMNAENFLPFLSEVWNFRKRGSRLKAVGISGYAVVGALCKLEDVIGVQSKSDKA